jgi:hypothetical protein
MTEDDYENEILEFGGFTRRLYTITAQLSYGKKI